MGNKQENTGATAIAVEPINTFYRNTSENCAQDAVQVLLNNQLGGDAHASLRIVNKGKCPVIIGTGTERGDFSAGGKETLIPQGARETVRVKVPGGTYLMASCINNDRCDCDWMISDVMPLG